MAYNPNPRVELADSSALDAFGNLRVSEGHIRFSSAPLVGKMSQLWSETTNGTGSATYIESAGLIRMTLDSGSTTGMYVKRRQRRSNLYRPGHSMRIAMTFRDSTTAAGNARADIGYFDDDDGIFLRSNGADAPWSLVFRSSVTGSPVDTVYAQSTWDDPMDSTGPSGLTLDRTKVQILMIDFQYLGAGRVRVFLDIDGVAYKIHEFRHANINTTTYWRTGSLPLSYELVALGTAGATQNFDAICAGVSREGGDEELGFETIASTGLTTIAVTAANEQSLVSIRLRPDSGSTTYRHCTLRPIRGTVHLTSGTSFGEWRLLRNPTFSSGSLTWANNGIISQRSVTPLTITGAEAVIAAGFFERGNVAGVMEGTIDVQSQLIGGMYNPSTADVITLTAKINSGSDPCIANLTYIEYL